MNPPCFAHRTSSWEKHPAVIDDQDRETPWQDPIVAEVRAARVALLAGADWDLEKLAERLRQEQVRSGHPVVTLAPRVPEPTRGEAA